MEKRRLCFTSSVCGLVIQLFFFPISFSDISVLQTANWICCLYLSEVGRFWSAAALPEVFLWFLSKLILTYSVSVVRFGLHIHLCGDDDQKGKYENFVFRQQLVVYKTKSNQPKQSCSLSKYVAVRALLQKFLMVSICNELILSFILLHNASGRSKGSDHLLIIFCPFFLLVKCFSYFILGEWQLYLKVFVRYLWEWFGHLCSCISINWNGKRNHTCFSGWLCWVILQGGKAAALEELLKICPSLLLVW